MICARTMMEMLPNDCSLIFLSSGPERKVKKIQPEGGGEELCYLLSPLCHCRCRYGCCFLCQFLWREVCHGVPIREPALGMQDLKTCKKKVQQQHESKKMHLRYNLSTHRSRRYKAAATDSP